MNKNISTGPGKHSPDGSPVELYRLLMHRGEADIIEASVPARCDLLELGAGAGRVTRPLIELGHQVTAVDFSAEMLSAIRGAEVICADIVGLRLARKFPAVILGSCLVNVVEPALRRQFLETCAWHVEPEGCVLLEHHDESLLGRAQVGLVGTDPNGMQFSWLSVRVEEKTVTGTLEYRFRDRSWTQSFSTCVLSQAELESELLLCGLQLTRQLTTNWLEARLIR